MDNTKQGTPRVRINSLRTVRDCERELARIYRALRNGELDTGMAKACTYILSVLVSMKRDGDLEARLEVLERST